jgi:polar amino acid transport system permease protein
MRATQNLISTQLAAGVAGVTTLFVNVLLIYFVVAQVINALFRLAERQLGRRYEERRGRHADPIPEPAA